MTTTKRLLLAIVLGLLAVAPMAGSADAGWYWHRWHYGYYHPWRYHYYYHPWRYHYYHPWGWHRWHRW